MEWYEHRHDHEPEEMLPRETEDMTVCQRLAMRLAGKLHVPYGHLAATLPAAETAAVKALFASELGERSALTGDEILVLAAGESHLPEVIFELGGAAVLLRIPTEAPIVTASSLEQKLSFSTRAVIVDHTAACIENLLTVRNFCNKYDLWMLEIVGERQDVDYVIDGKKYRIGTVGDWSVFALRDALRGGALFTRDAFVSRLIANALDADNGQMTERVAEALQREEAL